METIEMGQSGPRALFTPTSLSPSAHAPASPVRRPSGFCSLFAPSTAGPGGRPGEEEEEEEEEEEAAAAMKLSTQAYCKMVLHGAKYPHCAINGLLVAEKQPPPPPQRGRERESPAQALLVDCIPLFHGSLALAPMLEVALSLIDSWCRENSYVIAGYYQANERVKDASPNLLAEKVASRIAENFSDTALIMVDNTKFTMKCLKPAVHVYEHHENKWRCRDPHIDYCEDWTEAQRISKSLLDSRSYETLVDFDNHLDDIRNDWTNPEINKAVLHLC